MIRLLTLPAGFILDLLMGDPRWLYHPVCLIGNLISILEKGIKKVIKQTRTTSRMPPARSPLSVFGNTLRIPFLFLTL